MNIKFGAGAASLYCSGFGFTKIIRLRLRNIDFNYLLKGQCLQKVGNKREEL
jgi:hypothetical protein